MISFSTSAVAVEPTIRSVQIATSGPIHVKPCEPVFLTLDVIMDRPEHANPPRQVPFDLADNVTINGELYRAGFSSINSVAWFERNSWSVTNLPGDKMSFVALAALVWNAKDKKFLFDEPGEYRIGFLGGAEIIVLVEEPTTDEQVLIARMKSLGSDFVSFIFEPMDRKVRRKIAPHVEAMLKDFPNTAYTPLLSVALGRSTFVGHADRWVDDPAFDLRAYCAERLATARKFFELHCRGTILSPLQAKGAEILANEIMTVARHAPSEDAADAQELRAEAIELLRAVADSPYSSQSHRQAESALERLGESN